MKGYVEKLIVEYPRMLKERAVIKRQLFSFEMITEEDMITSMCFSRPDGERVQTSNISDKTASVALIFREKQRKMNEDRMAYLIKEYERLDEEIIFLEYSIKSLPENLSQVMQALVLQGMTWDEVEHSLFLNRRTISEYRKKAINNLVRDYQTRESQMESYLLS